MIKCLIYLILFLLHSQSHTLKPGNTFELQCPDGALNSIPTIRTFAIVLNIAQKNMEIYIYTQRAFGTFKNNTKDQSNNNKIKENKQVQKPFCILTRNNKICVFDGFISQLKFQCNNEGTVSLLLLQPVFVPQTVEISFVRQKMISPVLAEGERGIIKFRPDINIEVNAENLDQFFIANCIQSISYFQQQFLIGVKGSKFIQAIMASEGVTGIWKFNKIRTIIDEPGHVIDSYSSENEQITFYIEEENKKMYVNRNFYGFKFLVSSENEHQIKKLSINVSVLLRMQSLLFEQFNQSICIKEGELQSKIPLKLSFFYSFHSIISISISFNRPTHYSIQLSEPLEIQNNLVVPIIEEDQYIFYSYKEGEIIEKIKLFAHIQKYYRSKTTPALEIKSSGVKNLSAALVVEQSNEGTKKIDNLTDSLDSGIKIKLNRIDPIQSKSNDSFVQISLEVEPFNNAANGAKKQKMSFFKLMLKTALTPIQIQIGKPASQFLFQNEVKRFYIPKQKMELVKSKILKVICTQCEFFLTYNQQCSNINCCQYAHLSKIDVKPNELNIFVVSLMHSTDTALIKLHIFEDYGAYILSNGQIIQGLLPDSQTFIFDVDGRQNIQIIFNSQLQSILMLATLTKNQFPNKNSFDYQSNEGYIFIPAPKMKKTIYIKLIRMISSIQSIESLESLSKIPYSIVAVTESSRIELIEAKKFTNIVKKSGVKQYVLKHMCNPQENIYLRIQSKSYSTSFSSNLYQNRYILDVEVKVEPINISFVTKIDFSETIDITNMMKSKSIANIQPLSICDFKVVIKNLANETLYINLLFFKQKQLDQITVGEFSQQHILSQNLLLYCIFDSEKDLNIYAYSLKEEIALTTMIISVTGVQKLRFIYAQKQPISLKTSDSEHIFEKIVKNYNLQINSALSSSNPSYSQYKHIEKLNKSDKNGHKRVGNITVLLLQIRRSSIDGGFQKNDIFVVCTHEKTKASLGSRVHYQIMHEGQHKFEFPLSFEMVSGQQRTGKQKLNFNNQKQIILQTTKLDGRYFVKASITYFGQTIGQIDISKKQKSSSPKSKQTKSSKQEQIFLSEQSIVFIKVDQLRSILADFTNKNAQEDKMSKGHFPADLSAIQFSNLLLEFHITCSKKIGDYCSFLTSFQTSNSDIRQLTPGVPQIFHINKHSSIIFIYNNYKYDREFKFKVNRKLGFPNYKLCSYRTPQLKQFNSDTKKATLQQQSESLDKCLSQLKNPENQLNLRIEDNAFDSDANNIVGRTHQLIINQHNQNYCTNCTYYLGLYSDYDVVEGSIFAMNGNQPTFLEEGSSITTIVYRGEPDTYIISNWKSLMGIIYQLEGEIQVEVYYYEKDMMKKQVGFKNDKKKEEKNRQLRNIIAINLIEQAKKYQLKQYYLSIKPLKNLPSALYTLVIMSKEEQIINIKDGVPYQMKYTPDFNVKSSQRKINPLIKYRYRCENQGIAMISSKNFDDLEIEIRCRDSIMSNSLSGSGINNQINQDEDQKKQGDIIDYLEQLKTEKSRQISNRVDINVSPKICVNYQIAVTSKTPSVWYSILISSTDIITLPLNKQIAGLLKYQTKLYQIYQININERTETKCVFKFCQAGQGRIMISKSKSNLFAEIYEQEIQINEDSTSETLKYTAKPGLFYIKVEFKASGGVLQYTLHVQNTNVNGKFYGASLNNLEANPIQIYNGFNTIKYKVKRLGVDFTQYEIQFYPLKLSSEVYDVSYYLVQSTKLKLLKKTQNCNGQYFIELVNHHEQIIETKIKFDQKSIDFGNFKGPSTYDFNKYKIKLNYSTKLYQSFITVIPIVYNNKLHEFSHIYVPKYHQIQLTNGQIYSKVTYLLSQIAYKIEQVVDIHGSEDLILVVIGLMICLCFIVAAIAGVMIGRKYFFRVQTVYVLKEIKQQQNEDDEDNRIEDDVANSNTQVQLVRQQIENESNELEERRQASAIAQPVVEQQRQINQERVQADKKEEEKMDIFREEGKRKQNEEIKMEDQQFQRL